LVDEAGATMNEIVTSVKHVADIMSEITAASEEQSSGIEQINQAISQIDEMTQQNAALVEQAAAAAQSMQNHASALAEAVAVFKLSNLPAAKRMATPDPKASLPTKPAQAVTATTSAAPARALKVQPDMQPRAQPVPSPGGDWEEF
ncbi:MAG TPA: methyl-accepting chemotaxis protein, partial [Noviherbaspirillum sp.]|uniref:methyl-accepting chemotaxis protein n=1 Tax=Noviherbaspirillum sp. TaxID=1926288 RepID=UPI002DDD7E7D